MKRTAIDLFLLCGKQEDGNIDELVCLQVDDSKGAVGLELLREEAEAPKRSKTRISKVPDDGQELKFYEHYVKRNG